MNIQIKLLHPDAKIPKRANAFDAGADLFATHNEIIMPRQRKLIGTGISISVPQGYYARIAPRSGLAFKAGIDVMAGVIDSGYLGEIKCLLINLADGEEEETVIINKGDRIAQLIIEQCFPIVWEAVDELKITERGVGGFGSSDLPKSTPVDLPNKSSIRAGYKNHDFNPIEYEQMK